MSGISRRKEARIDIAQELMEAKTRFGRNEWHKARDYGGASGNP
jgi:hypothetical protein